MGKTKAYHVGSFFWALAQFAGWVVSIPVTISIIQDATDFLTPFIVILVESIILFGSLWLDILIRGISKGKWYERILLCLAASPFRLLLEIITSIRLQKASKRNKYSYAPYERGDYKSDYFGNRMFYIFMNKDADEEIGKPKPKPLTPEQRAELELKRKEREEKEAREKAEKEAIFNEKLSKCNVKFVLFGRQSGFKKDTRFWSSDFLHKSMSSLNEATGTWPKGYVEEACLFHSIIIDGKKVNRRSSSVNLNMYLAPGQHTIKVRVLFNHKVYKNETNLNAPFQPDSSTYGTKIYMLDRTETLYVDIKPGYHYTFAAFAALDPVYNVFTSGNKFCYAILEDVKRTFVFDLMTEAEILKVSQAHIIEKGQILEDFNNSFHY